MGKRKICVVTGTRAEYGLLQGIMGEIRDDPDLELQVIVTGSHLVREFGLTYQTIEDDGFKINHKIDMLLASDTPLAITKSMGLALIGFADALDRLKPDIMILLGDRYEILTAAQAALVARIPVAHIHGGEVTEGAMDESIRHAVTKIARLHFVSAKEYGIRVKQLGENPDHVYTVGAPGLDYIRNMTFMSPEELGRSLSFDVSKPILLMTYHPVTLADRDEVEVLNGVLKALEDFPDYKIIITYPNADTYGRRLIARLEEFTSQNSDRIVLMPSLGQLRYLSAAKIADVVIGNSSSGIIEVPSLGTPTLDIGIRQKGRLFASSVIHCEEDYDSVREGLKLALTAKKQEMAQDVLNPYGDGRSVTKIVNVLKNIQLVDLKLKPFFDMSCETTGRG